MGKNSGMPYISPLRLPRAIWMLGFVSLFMDISSELVHSLLPVFVTATLGASVASLGFLEGGAEAVAMISKMFSGVLSDWMGKRKVLAVIGYGLAAITKPMFPLAQTVSWVFAARYIDRIGKGIRGAPRDALVGDLAPPELRGAAYGLRQSLDTVGAFIGPLLAIGLMLLFSNHIHAVLWFAVFPAFLAVGLLMFGVEEPKKHAANGNKIPLQLKDIRKLSNSFWWVVIVGGTLTLARFSEAFLILRAQNAGLSVTWVPSVMIVMSLVYALVAYPVGILSDRIERRLILMIGVAFLVAADVVLALSGSITGVMGGVALWGLHMGFTQGLLAALVADTTQPELRGTAFGFFNFASGILLLIASALAGLLWEIIGAQATFLAGACFSGLAFVGLGFITIPVPTRNEQS